MANNDRSAVDVAFETAFLADLGERVASLTPMVSTSGDFKADKAVVTALRFTTAKAKLPGLTIKETEKGYRLSGARGLLRAAHDLRSYIMADNQRVQLKFSEDLLNFEPEDELIKKSAVPLWILKSNADGSVAIERTWGQ